MMTSPRHAFVRIQPMEVAAQSDLARAVFHMKSYESVNYVRKEKQMARQLISSGSAFEADIGYSRALVDGDWVFVSGTTGFDYNAMTISDSIVDQTEQALRNIGDALHQAGCSYADVVRVNYILTEASDFKACWPILRKYFGEVRPAATMIVAGLLDARMKIEIEVTARRSV